MGSGSGSAPAADDRHSPRSGFASFHSGGDSSSASPAAAADVASPQTENGAVDKALRQNDPTRVNNLQEGEMDLRNAESNDSAKDLFEHEELVPSLATGSSALDVTYPGRDYDLASSSAESEILEPFFTNLDSSIASLMDDVNPIVCCGDQPSLMGLSSNMAQLQLVDLHSNMTLSARSSTSEVLSLLSTVPNFVSSVSDSSASRELLGEEVLPEVIPSGAVPPTSSGSREHRSGSVNLDAVSIFSILPSGSGEVGMHEARRYSRRMFWDFFSRRTSRRFVDSEAIYLSTEDNEDLQSHNRWLHDLGDDMFENETRDDLLYLHHRSHGASGLRWHSRSEVRERLGDSLDENNGGTTFCPSGLHQDETCPCYSSLVAEESSTRASISRIFMLAEALFEVLDQIQRQPVSSSLSVVLHPAPESLVNSLPLKSHKKLKIGKCGENEEQCYICLSEYEEGENIRVLPCCHEYHMSCIDKWLKEIHGICPLCRGDVCGGASDETLV